MMALVTHLLIVNSSNSAGFRFLGLLILFAVSFSIHSKHVLAADTDKDMCKFAQYTNENQESLAEARKRLAPLAGKTFESHDGVQWEYNVGICTHVGDDKDVPILQIEKNNDNSIVKEHRLGSLQESHIIVGTDWIMLEYRGGELYGSHCNNEKKRSVIMITCDPNIDDNQAQMVFMKEENSKTEQCYYLFEMKHQAVCPTMSGGGTLSVGTILVIVFFSVLAVYLVIGFLYARLVLRAKGIEQIPNYEFWKDFGNLQADGCDFIFRTKNRRRMDHFGGIGDDQLESAEEIRDDNLLPITFCQIAFLYHLFEAFDGRGRKLLNFMCSVFTFRMGGEFVVSLAFALFAFDCPVYKAAGLCLSSSGSYPTWETLPVAVLPSTELLRSWQAPLLDQCGYSEEEGL